MENEEIKELPEEVKMTPRSFRDYILTHMTAEEALLRLLEGPLLTYQKLKFPEGEQEVHPLIIASMAAMDMGWDFLIEKQDGSEEVRGFSIGSQEYFDDLLKKKE